MTELQQKPHLVQLAPAPAPSQWIVFDLETGNADEKAVEAAVSAWKAPRNWKPETAAKNRAEYAAKVRDQAALLDASPILCVGLRTPTLGLMFSGMGQGHLSEIPGWSAVIECADERAMLSSLGGWLNTATNSSTVLAGFNVRNFDLPKLRGAYVRHRLPLPNCLRPAECGPSQPITDVMHLFKHFSMEHRDSLFVSLNTVCMAFGIERPKQLVSGADVPRMYRDGEIASLLTYCAIDVSATAEIYKLMVN